MDRVLALLMQRPAMDAEREHRLAVAARAGDAVARRQLVEDSLRLVVLRAQSLGHRGDALHEAIQEGTLALMAAVDRFDPDRGCRLATYAWPWITHAMQPRSRPESPSERLDEAPSPAPPEPAEDLRSLLAVLPRDLVEVVTVRFRIGEPGGIPRSRRKVGEMLDLTEAQVRVREARAMRYLRGHLAKVCDRAPRRGVDPL
ncbi:sigma-70 family RNA polymerase sigma factor [Aeromicrobium terrae]|uniref:Sigma-70 family RNA polymerase sigma factor n=1 Tax=Aeromicrobium terrae TaxID=2498846 RepID=A0A5C8NNP9_9ACTN|nr:sigma-70 family RNA polymerase sigma factor [Aeromicrobium terrae]TXL62720.1 sigma-70 family RNA polymerase sigma factor [Aeromicrobium terrae]